MGKKKNVHVTKKSQYWRPCATVEMTDRDSLGDIADVVAVLEAPRGR